MQNSLIIQNPEITIRPVTAPSFAAYGKVLNAYDFTSCIRIMEERPIPREGNVYVAADPAMTADPVALRLASRFYGNMPVQIGYCNGNNSKLNALEYHKSSEIDVAVTDLVLLLAPLWKIREDNTLPVSEVEAFYVPAQIACELYATTLHFSPCKVSDKGFKSIIVLPAGTNEPLSLPADPCKGEEELLWMRNKWLIAHEDAKIAGAFCGLKGENISIV